jgi:hypothetical protein
VLDLNAHEAMHLIELRSGREGHPSYLAVAHEMHRLTGEIHPGVAGAMTHVDQEREARGVPRAQPGRAAHGEPHGGATLARAAAT